MYISIKDNLPTMSYDPDYGVMTSGILLVYSERYDTYCLATYEQYDEDTTPQWYSCDSERWNKTQDVSHWSTFERIK